MFVRHKVLKISTPCSLFSVDNLFFVVTFLSLALIPINIVKADSIEAEISGPINFVKDDSSDAEISGPINFVKDDSVDAETYGPIKKGQALWNIAKEVNKNVFSSDKSISIEQLVYAIYKLNPDAFNSANMNILVAGSTLTLPNSESVKKTSIRDASKQLAQHTHALDLLRVDAQQLRSAKIKSRHHQRQTKALQKQLAKYRHKSRAWNKTYRAYVTSKRKEINAKNQVAKLSALLREKATLKKPIRVVRRDNTKSEITEVNNRLGQIQSSLENLNISNSKLVDQVEQLATLDERVKVLEEELGKNDELVIELKNTLDTVQQAIKQQQLESKDLYQRLKELKASNSVSSKTEVNEENIETYRNPANAIQNNSEKSIADSNVSASVTVPVESQSTQINTTDVEESITGNTAITKIKAEDTDDKAASINKKELQLASNTSIDNVNKETANSIDEDYKSTYFADIGIPETAKAISIKSSFKMGNGETESITKNQENNATTENQINGRNIQDATNTVKIANSRQPGNTQKPVIAVGNKWVALIKDNLFIIASILNGLILIYVFYSILSRRQRIAEIEETEPDNQGPKQYIPWQERVKPKRDSYKQ